MVNKVLLKILKSLAILLAGSAGVVLTLVFLSVVMWRFQYIIVLSGSMTPAMPVGAVIGVRPVDPAQIAVGDIITHWHPNDSEVLVTHRVVELTTSDDGGLAFRTKGDANEEPDGYLVPAEYVSGRALFAIPRVGYLRDYVKTLPGLALLILLPAGLLLTNEFMSVSRESNPRYKALTRRRRHAARR